MNATVRDIGAEAACACRVLVSNDRHGNRTVPDGGFTPIIGGVAIKYCSLHIAAPEMLELLQKIAEGTCDHGPQKEPCPRLDAGRLLHKTGLAAELEGK